MELTLIRVGQSEKGTFGVLRQGQVPFALTLERPWLDNQQRVSSVPTGQYDCQRIVSPKFGETFEITHVPDRSHVLFHKGNSVEDTAGCVLVAEEFGGTYEAPILVSSARGFQELMTLLQGQDTFHLTIHQIRV